MKSTPWGTADRVVDVAPGLRWVMTPGLGGLEVELSLALAELPEHVRDLGVRHDGSIWYDDVAWTWPCVAAPEFLLRLNLTVFKDDHVTVDDIAREMELSQEDADLIREAYAEVESREQVSESWARRLEKASVHAVGRER